MAVCDGRLGVGPNSGAAAEVFHDALAALALKEMSVKAQKGAAGAGGAAEEEAAEGAEGAAAAVASAASKFVSNVAKSTLARPPTYPPAHPHPHPLPPTPTPPHLTPPFRPQIS